MQPVTFLEDRWYCVDDIFVESKIEVIDNTKSDEDPGKWSYIKTRHNVFSESSFESYITIEGDHGFGKSTLLMQYAYDWYTSNTISPLKDIDIFILLQLKDFIHGSSLFDEIRMTLPGDVQLSSKDIKDVITSGHWKVLVALDGYDKNVTDINQVLPAGVLTDCVVVITTNPQCVRRLEEKHLSGKKHYKLRGFDQHMQETFIDKAATSKVRFRGDKQCVMRLLRENVNLSNICQVPFFFAAFVHSTRVENGEQQLSNDVTNLRATQFLDYIVRCFFNRPKNKRGKIRWSKSNLEEDSTQRMLISKLAFDGFIGCDTKYCWTKADLVEQLGAECYKRYVNTGLLLEEEHRTSNSQADNELVVTTHARFLNKAFQEFYAAFHIALLANHQDANVVVETLRKLSQMRLEYVPQFACGFNPVSARVVHKYLRFTLDRGKCLAVLCLMEQRERDIDEKLAELCADKFLFHYDTHDYAQKYEIKLLQRASQRNVSINCFNYLFLLFLCVFGVVFINSYSHDFRYSI